MKWCTNCGAQLKDEEKYCSKCGAKQDADSISENVEKKETGKINKKRKVDIYPYFNYYGDHSSCMSDFFSKEEIKS